MTDVEKVRRRNSPSSIICFKNCPREYFYKYVLRLPTPPTPSLIKGTVQHEVLENFYDEYEPDMDARMARLIEESWNKQENINNWAYLNATPEQLEAEKQDIINMTKLHLELFKMKMKIPLDTGRAHGEKHAFNLLKPKFKEMWIEDKELNLGGYIDRITTDYGDRITISDYKTSNVYTPGVSEDYDLQCGLYALLYRKQFNKWPDFVEIIYLRTGQEVRTRVTPPLINWTLKFLKYTNEATTSDNIEDYPMLSSRWCTYCPFFDKDSGLEEYQDNEKIKQIVQDKMKAEKEKKDKSV